MTAAVRTFAADVAAELNPALDRACAWAPLSALVLFAMWAGGAR